MVEHRPPLNLLFWSAKTLPVKVAGIDVNANGYSWLQSVVVNRQITFIPVRDKTTGDYAECCVYFYDRSNQGKSTRRVDVGQALLTLGFAKMSVSVPKRQPAASKDPFEKHIQAYFRSLVRSENVARDRRVGLWQQR